MQPTPLRIALLGLAAGVLTGPALACGDEHADHVVIAPGGVMARAAVLVGDDKHASVFNDGEHTVEVTVDGDNVQVVVDGKPIPAGRVEQHDGKLTILDENGNEMDAFSIFVNPGGGVVGGTGQFWRFGDKDNLWFGQDGEPPKVMLGVTMSEPSPELRKHLRLEEGVATMLTGVYDGLPAALSGLEQYDVIVAIDGNPQADPESIRQALRDREPGDEVTFTVIQSGRTKEYSIELAPFDSTKLAIGRLPGGNKFRGEMLFVPDPNEPGMRVLPPDGNNWQEWAERFSKDIGKQFGGPGQFQWRRQIGPEHEVGEHVDDDLERLESRIRELQEAIDRLIQQSHHEDE